MKRDEAADRRAADAGVFRVGQSAVGRVDERLDLFDHEPASFAAVFAAFVGRPGLYSLMWSPVLEMPTMMIGRSGRRASRSAISSAFHGRPRRPSRRRRGFGRRAGRGRGIAGGRFLVTGRELDGDGSRMRKEARRRKSR